MNTSDPISPQPLRRFSVHPDSQEVRLVITETLTMDEVQQLQTELTQGIVAVIKHRFMKGPE